MNGSNRVRLPADKLPPSCPKVPGVNLIHVGERLQANVARVYRIDVLGDGGDHGPALKGITRIIEELCKSENGKTFICDGTYAFALIVNEEGKRERVEQALSSFRPTLPQGVVVVVETAPSPGNYSLFA